MYTSDSKKFRPKKLDLLEQEIQQVARSGQPVSRVFLADGDAMMLPFDRLVAIINLIHENFPQVTRISSYCLPRNLKNKTVEQLQQLKTLGLSLVYVGCESGDDQVLELINKGETFQSSLDALLKLKQSGIKSSVMILNGLGGVELSKQHAINSAKLMNMAQPEYLSTLVVSFPLGVERFAKAFNGKYAELSQRQLFQEMETLLDELTLDKTIFRSDHASNYLVLKGVLGKDKQSLLTQVRTALHQPQNIRLREEWQRGL